MSGRNATAGVLTEMAKAANQPFHLVQIELDDETVYMTDLYRNIDWGGNTYYGVGHFLEFTDIEENAELTVSELTAALSGVDQSHVSLVLTEQYIDRTIRIYKAFLDDTDAIKADPFLFFEGRMDGPSVEEDPDATDRATTVAVSATNHWVDFERRPGRHTNHEEQQLHFPGDMGFEFASEIVTDIVWGRSK